MKFTATLVLAAFAVLGVSSNPAQGAPGQGKAGPPGLAEGGPPGQAKGGPPGQGGEGGPGQGRGPPPPPPPPPGQGKEGPSQGRGPPPGEGKGGLASVCTCDKRNPCRFQDSTSTTPVKLGCIGTNNYTQCLGTACTVVTCPDGQVWNATKQDCSTCSTGMHVAADKLRCVCDQGTTPERGTCVACPTGSVQNPDNCTCPTNQIVDRETNMCKACPANSALIQGSCRCSDTLFWNAANWACEDCPGTWTSVKQGRARSPQKCSCEATPADIFDVVNVKCYTCPSFTTASTDDRECVCNTRIPGQMFNMTTQLCACKWGTELNTAQTACSRIMTTTPLTPP